MSRDRGDVAIPVLLAASAAPAVIVAVSQSAQDTAQFVLTVVSIAAVVIGGIGWVIRREVKSFKAEVIAEVADKTRPIQPTANGGLSMTDLHKKVDDGFAHANERIDRTELRQLAMQEQLRDVSDRLPDGKGSL